jgi:DedD protein
MNSVNVRNLEQIQEDDARRQRSRFGALLLASIGGAALVVASVVMAKRSTEPARSQHDPLEQLVVQSSKAGKAPEKLDGQDVTFPEILSDEESPTTALAAVKDERGRLVNQSQNESLPPGAPTTPPIPGDRLPVQPLPAGTLLSATPVTTEPKDGLTSLAANASKLDEGAELAPSGMDGGYQIQVASFREQADADAFVQKLRQRGHRAFRQAAYVHERGLWHRVRIGPFKTKFQANLYKDKFEKSERTSCFVVDPHRVKRLEETRALKLAIRKKKYGKP